MHSIEYGRELGHLSMEGDVSQVAIFLQNRKLTKKSLPYQHNITYLYLLQND